MHNQSIWAETVTMPNFLPLTQDIKTDTLIIGGGMTGLLCGHFMKEQGRDYILIEQNQIAGHTTAGTTAKITTQHGLIYSNLLRYQGEDIAQGYYLANKEALQRLTDMAQNTDCDFEYQTNLVYDMESEVSIEDEIKALEEIGGAGIFVKKPEGLPVTPKAAIATLNQAQFHPLKFAKAIAAPQQEHIYEKTRALGIEKEGTGYIISTADGHAIRAKEVIIATHFPFKNIRGLYFIKMHQSRSYEILLEGIGKDKLPPFMAMGSQPENLSLRTYKDKLILGGHGGKTGENHGNFNQLLEDARHYYPEAKVTRTWAAQDCMTLDQMPYIGNHNPSYENIKVATGYNKWGMTNSMVAALALTDQMEREIADIFYPHRSMAHPQVLVNLATSTANLLKLKRPRCSHLGCALVWNKEEQSWDCPCHGSRFHKEGSILNEPAQKPITKPSGV
ncbi:MAG: FAD-dependent oxidoreductase [Firmicutes bacterium]|nr:FAD-dependent oxidoreductase [Bacillota bacterium]